MEVRQHLVERGLAKVQVVAQEVVLAGQAGVVLEEVVVLAQTVEIDGQGQRKRCRLQCHLADGSRKVNTDIQAFLETGDEVGQRHGLAAAGEVA